MGGFSVLTEKKNPKTHKKKFPQEQGEKKTNNKPQVT